jgi:hypothetical protein
MIGSGSGAGSVPLITDPDEDPGGPKNMRIRILNTAVLLKRTLICMLLFLKQLLVQIVSKTASEFLFQLSFSVTYRLFSSVNVIAGFWDNFQGFQTILMSQADTYLKARTRGFLVSF